MSARTSHTSQAGTAAVLSFVFSGLGQLYNGQIAKGLLIVLCSVIALLLVVAGALLIATWMLGKTAFPRQAGIGIACFLLGVSGISCLAIYSIVDAYRSALRQQAA